MNAEKLKYNELKDFRELLLKGKQKGICPLCLHEIKLEDAVLDHSHVSGHIRCAIHPECNILLGKIENFLNRWSRGLNNHERLANFLGNAYGYMVASYVHNPLHPKHNTGTDKLMKKYRRLLKRSKKPETKAKYKKLIQELK